MAVLALIPGPSAACPPPNLSAAPTVPESPGPACAEPDAVSLARRLGRLAQRHRESGEEHEAEPLLRRALEIQERSLGPVHPHVALTLSSLMFLYRHQGKEEEAAAAADRAATILVSHARQIRS
jgi:hypothetical protein